MLMKASRPRRARTAAGIAALSRAAPEEKTPFDIQVAMRRLHEAVRPYPKAALFELAGEGFDSPFEQLVACIISIRTRDEVTLPTSRRLFAAARTPEQIRRLTPAEIDTLIH